MLGVEFKKHGPVLRVLCLGAHPDDIEIGCGGTILRMLEEYGAVEVYWRVFTGSAERRAEGLKSAGLFLASAQKQDMRIGEFRDGFLPFMAVEVKEYFEVLKAEVMPDVIFTHHRSDLHQDHRFISDLTWNTFRDHLILEYEIPKYDGDLGVPNFFVDLPVEVYSKKVQYIIEAFATQGGRRWFTAETFLALMKLRGNECNASSTYAEAFYCRKIVY